MTQSPAALLRATLFTGVLVAVLAILVSHGTQAPLDASVPAATPGVDKIGGEIPELVPGTVQEGARIYITTHRGMLACTIGAVLDARTAVTAAHCGAVGDAVSMTGEQGSPVVGRIHSWLDRSDVALVELTEGTPVSAPTRLIDPSAPLPAGLQVAAHGATSGRQTGYLVTGKPVASVGSDGSAGESVVVESTICTQGGDSGGPVYQAGTDTLIGIVVALRDPLRNHCRGLISPVSQWRAQ
jgi:hypothetical protein